MSTPTPRTPAARPRERSRWLSAIQAIGAFTALLWLIEAVDVLLDHRLDGYGVQPRESDGLVGILFAPLLHGGWDHLAANTGPVLILGFLLLLSGVGYWLGVTAVVWLVGGVGVWVTAQPHSIHLGASVLVFGWLTCLLVQGLVSGRFGQIALGVVLLIVYGSMLWGVLPNQPGISWQGHLFGAVGGVLGAVLLAPKQR